MVKIKEVHVTANYAWSPAENHPVYIAAGTAAQQLDATFSSNANLELFAIDITDPALIAKCAGKVEVANRFHKVVWGSTYSDSPQANGVIVCGTDQGGIEIYDPIKILNGDAESLVLSTSDHTGPVRALDFNAFQKNLFASGASDSEIFIWDLKNLSKPMTPGKKTQPTSAVSSVAWNRQVQHILASTTTLTSGPCCVVWDLRKNEPIIKVQDPSGRMQCSDVAWHPEVATQLVLASEDDHAPVVQLWDLRFATSPMKVLEKHQRGVVSMSWCPRDPDLLLTCGKDNQVYCWNPNATPPEVVYELETHAQWCFDVQWCPRNPNIVSTGSFDGKISIHSMMGGGAAIEEVTASEKQINVVAESFGTEAAFTQHPSVPATKKKVGVPLKKPPKWMRKPCGANFVFGGKLVSFTHEAPSDNQQQQSIRRTVNISQVVTDDKLLDRAKQLRSALTDDTQCSDYCQRKVDGAKNEFEENIWNFLKVNFNTDSRKQYLQLLGYNASDLKTKFSNMLGTKAATNGLSSQVDALALGATGEPNVAAMSNSSSTNGMDAFDEIVSAAEASSQKNEKNDFSKPMLIPVADDDMDSLISQALLIGDYDAAVDLCLHGNRMADAIVVAIAGGPALLEKTQKQYFASSESKISRLLSAVVTKNWKDIVSSCDLDNWKEALASLLTYASPEDLIKYCDVLGERLEVDKTTQSHAFLCYVCSGNIDKLVQCWDKSKPSDGRDTEGVQDLIEKMMVLLRVVETRTNSYLSLGEAASDKLATYASTLASQGQLNAALEILPGSSDKHVIQVLRDRLFHSQGDTVARQNPPPFPFAREGFQLGQRPSAQVQPQRHQARSTYGQQSTYPQPTSNIQSVQDSQQTYTQPASSTGRQRSNNPYAATQPIQRNTYSAPQATPSNMFAPQSVAPTSAPNMGAFQPPSTMYQPYTPPVSNSTQMMQPQAPSAPVPPSPSYDSYGDGTRPPVSGWNDPPPVDPNRVPRRKKQTPKPYIPENLNIFTPQQPALAPPGLAPGGPMPPSGFAGPGNVMPPALHMGHNPSQGSMIGVVNQPPTSAQPAMMQNMQQPVSTASVPTAAPKDTPKPPIPSEHQVLQKQFDELIIKCQSQTTNQQMKRKLDDCSRRLEFLYDKLRANTLSPNIIGGLHQVAQYVVSRDYASGLKCHAQIVSHSNFSEISAFMPGLKSMIQIASQLRV